MSLEYRSQEKIWMSLSFSVRLELSFVLPMPAIEWLQWARVNGLQNHEAYHEDLTKECTKARVRSQLCLFMSKVVAWMQNTLKEHSWKDSKAWGGMKRCFQVSLSIKYVFALLRLTYPGSCERLLLCVSERNEFSETYSFSHKISTTWLVTLKKK